MSRPDRRVLLDVGADGLGCQRHHVLAGGVAGGELEVEEDVVALDSDAQVAELAEAGGGLGLAAEVLDVFRRPQHEQPRLGQTDEGEAGRPADALVEQHRRAAAGIAEQLATAAVGGHQCRLRRGQRDVVVAAGKDAVDAQRPRQADRHLHRADEVLDVVLVKILAPCVCSSRSCWRPSSGTGRSCQRRSRASSET